MDGALFDSRLGRGPGTPGDTGQFILADHPFSGVGSPRFSDRCGWPVDVLGVPVLDWLDGDGVTPAQGPTPLTANGTINAGAATPWECGGAAVTATEFLTGGYDSVVAMDAGLTDDIVMAMLVRPLWTAAGNSRLLSTWVANEGIYFYWSVASSRFIWRLYDAGASVASVVTASPGSWHLISISCDRDGNQRLYQNGVLADTDAIGALGSIASGSGVGICCTPGGANTSNADISRVVMWYGAGIADITPDAWHRRLAAFVLGTMDIQGATDQPTFTRGSSSSKQVGAVWHLFGTDTPRAGSPDGLLAENASTNKVYNNIDTPAPGTGWSVTGAAVMTFVDDRAALVAAGLRECAPTVIQVANATGVVQYLYGGAQVGNVNAHSQSCFGRITAGAGVNIGLRRNATGAFAGVAMTDGYATRSLDENRTPANADCQFALEIPNGATVRVTMAQCEENTYATSPIPNIATAATATRPQDVLDTTVTPRDAEGSIEVGITPEEWGGTEPGADQQIVTRSGGAASIIRYESAGAGSYASEDGTSTVTPAVAPVDGTRNVTRVRWGDAGLSLDVDGTRAAAAYDGALASNGLVRLASGVSVLVDGLRIFRGESG